MVINFIVQHEIIGVLINENIAFLMSFFKDFSCRFNSELYDKTQNNRWYHFS